MKKLLTTLIAATLFAAVAVTPAQADSFYSSPWDWNAGGWEYRETVTHAINSTCRANENNSVRTTVRAEGAPLTATDLTYARLSVGFSAPGEPYVWKSKVASYDEYKLVDYLSPLTFKTFKPYRLFPTQYAWNDLKVQGPKGYTADYISVQIRYNSANNSDPSSYVAFKTTGWCE